MIQNHLCPKRRASDRGDFCHERNEQRRIQARVVVGFHKIIEVRLNLSIKTDNLRVFSGNIKRIGKRVRVKELTNSTSRLICSFPFVLDIVHGKE